MPFMGHLATSRDIFHCHNYADTTGCVAAKHPTKHKQSPTAKNYLAQNNNDNIPEKYCSKCPPTNIQLKI
jgi:hypothetical protein